MKQSIDESFRTLPFFEMDWIISRCARISFGDVDLENPNGSDKNVCVEWVQMPKLISKLGKVVCPKGSIRKRKALRMRTITR